MPEPGVPVHVYACIVYEVHCSGEYRLSNSGDNRLSMCFGVHMYSFMYPGSHGRCFAAYEGV